MKNTPTKESVQLETLKAKLKKEGVLRARVNGTSMIPLLQPDEQILIVSVQTAAIPRFEVIVFYQVDRLVIHYVWHWNQFRSDAGERVYITRGLNSGEDLPVSESEILGRLSDVKIPFRLKCREVIRALLGKI